MGHPTDDFETHIAVAYDAAMFGGLKDMPPTAIVFGLTAPALILLLLLLNGYHGRVVWPPAKGSLSLYSVYSQTGVVIGTMIFKLGWAVALFGWFWLANRSPAEQYAIRTAIAGLALIAVGLIVIVAVFLAYSVSPIRS